MNKKQKEKRNKIDITGYVSFRDYANHNSISVMNLFEDILLGKYHSAICLIKEDEKCVTSYSTVQEQTGTVSQSPDYISAKEYAEIHNLSYGVLIRKLKSGVYKTAVQEKSNRWYIRRDEPVDGRKEGYITSKEYADSHHIHYSEMSRLLREGYFSTAYQDSGKHWYLKESDVKTKPAFNDPEFEGYIALKEFAKKHDVNYGSISEDVRLGLYDDVIKKRNYRFIYIRENAKCLTDKQAVRGYVSLRKYADINEIDILVLRQDVNNGLYKTAKKINNRWYLKPQERCHSYRGMSNYITSSKYAEMNGVPHQLLITDITAGKYKTAVKHYKHWYIDKNEELKTHVSEDTQLKDKYISVAEYAILHNVRNKKVLADIKSGLYETAEYIGSRWYLKEDEPCKTLSEEYISLAAYAKMHGVSRIRLREDVLQGMYTTAVSHNGLRTYINKNEEFKSFDRRKKENKVQKSQYISVSKYADVHDISYQKLLIDVKAGVYETAEQRGSRWFIDESEPCKTVYIRKRKV